MTNEPAIPDIMDEIINLIDKNMDIKSTNTKFDDISALYTELSGDNVNQDTISQFILTLMRLERISKEEGYRLNNSYLSIKYT